MLVVSGIGVLGSSRHGATAGTSVVSVGHGPSSTRRVLVASDAARSADVARVLDPAARGAGATMVRWRGTPSGVRRLVVARRSRRVSVAWRHPRRVRRAALGSPFAPRTLHGILGDFDDFATASLLAVGALRKSSMDLCQLGEHGFVQLGLVRVNGGSMLTQVVET